MASEEDGGAAKKSFGKRKSGAHVIYSEVGRREISTLRA